MSDWSWWQNALAGNIGPMHEGLPQQGYYRTRQKGGNWEPVAIWFEEKWLAMRGDKMIHPEDAWNFARTNPISYEAYTKAIEGGGWDDEPEAATVGHNMPSDPFEALRIEFEAEKETAEQFLKIPVTTKAQADKAAILAKRIADIAKKATDLHKVEKQPSLDEGRRVDNKWRGLKEDPQDVSKKLKRHLDAYLIEQQRLERERQLKAQQEADQKRREAEEAAKKGTAEAERLRAEAAAVERAVEREAETKNASAGRTGAKVSLRTFVSARIVDYDAAVLALSSHPEMKELVQTLANRAVSKGVEVAGVERIEEQRSV